MRTVDELNNLIDAAAYRLLLELIGDKVICRIITSSPF